MASRTVLVTGGAGYIGSHTCRALHAAGWTPVTYDDLSTGHRQAVKWGPLEVGDILDRARLDAVFAEHAPVAVLHFAARSLVGESVTDPAKYYRSNVAGALTVLEAARDHGVTGIVFSSTAATYGIPDVSPIPPDAPTAPINPYGRSKRMIEQMLGDFDAAYGLRSVSLRYFNAAGADAEHGIGEAHDPETHLIPIVLQVALGDRAEIAMFGDDYPTPDGTCVRDYIHVADLADAHVRALDYLVDGGATTILNLGTGHGHSVREVVEVARAVTGHPIPARVAPRRPGDPPTLVADPGRSAEVLGWTPKHDDLHAIVASAWAWAQHGFDAPD